MANTNGYQVGRSGRMASMNGYRVGMSGCMANTNGYQAGVHKRQCKASDGAGKCCGLSAQVLVQASVGAKPVRRGFDARQVLVQGLCAEVLVQDQCWCKACEQGCWYKASVGARLVCISIGARHV
eukprot:1160859-Pelagomonas_calceolata.AAC.8